jgi:hypothetical protein
VVAIAGGKFFTDHDVVEAVIVTVMDMGVVMIAIAEPCLNVFDLV